MDSKMQDSTSNCKTNVSENYVAKNPVDIWSYLATVS